MLLVIEPNKLGMEHLTFNAALLRALARAPRRGRMVFMSERVHCEQIKRLLGPDGCEFEWREVEVVSGLERRFVRKFLAECLAVWKALAFARRERGRVLVLSLLANVLPFTIIFSRLFKRVPLHVILHGELESLLIPEKRTVTREGFWVELALLRLFDGVRPHLYVLGKGIRERLLERFPDARWLCAIRAIEHPYSFGPSPSGSGPGRVFLRVGFVGAASASKGAIEFFRLAKALSTYVAEGRLQFVIVGGLDRDCAAESNECVEVLAERAGGLDVQGFRSGIAGLDVALFVYRRDYRFTASGTVFDVINEGVEILSLTNEYLMDVARDDVEGGMKFFDSLEAIAEELRKRAETGARRIRFEYPRIKKTHSDDVASALAATVMSS